jgi:uncharacterized protein DUF6510
MKTEEMKLDGNAVGGMMLEIFGVEMTAAVAVCRGCGATGPFADVDVYMRAAGTVIRCRTCESVLVKIVRGDGRTWLDLGGLRTIELRA